MKDLKKYDIDCSKNKVKAVYEKRFKNNGEEYLKKVDEIDIEEDLKEKKLEINRIKEIYNNQERLKENELFEEYSEETKQKELELMQNYSNIDTYEFLNKTEQLKNLYNKMPEEIRKKYKDLSRFNKEYLPIFAEKTKKRYEEIKKENEIKAKKETTNQTKEEIQNQINDLTKKLEETK